MRNKWLEARISLRQRELESQRSVVRLMDRWSDLENFHTQVMSSSGMRPEWLMKGEESGSIQDGRRKVVSQRLISLPVPRGCVVTIQGKKADKLSIPFQGCTVGIFVGVESRHPYVWSLI